MKTSNSIIKIGTALANAQGEMEAAAKGAQNEHFRSKYADLAAVRAAIREPMCAHGLAYLQPYRLEYDTGGHLWVEVETLIIHGESGEFISEVSRMPVIKVDPHGVGSAITYCRRYALMSILCLSSEDDDGNAAASVGSPVPTRDKEKALTVGAAITYGKAADAAKKAGADHVLVLAGKAAADGGMNELGAWWRALSNEERDMLSHELAGWKAIAKAVDDSKSPKDA